MSKGALHTWQGPHGPHHYAATARVRCGPTGVQSLGRHEKSKQQPLVDEISCQKDKTIMLMFSSGLLVMNVRLCCLMTFSND